MQCLHVRQAVSAGLLNFVFKRNLSILSMCYINSKKKKILYKVASLTLELLCELCAK